MNKKLKFNDEQRREYLNMIAQVGVKWLEIFKGNTEFYSAAYWDLLSGIWKQGGAVRKTDATKMMVGIKSALTAAKYVESALKHKILLEQKNPQDARSRLVALSPEMKKRLDVFFDAAVGELKKASEQVQKKHSRKARSKRT